jgi:hypothetical protein
MLNQCYIFGGNINFMSLFVNVYHVFERIAISEIPDFISFYKYLGAYTFKVVNLYAFYV